ncbi:hypothetical protein C0V70_15840 [Bacteriovorax stolpii]|uniref:histidine kinase n=1 Tax=Bacteriovorax stolpii TaxID=960 RepID=A0A2K9NVK3_BACTC|nr:ATP-binding protein [Bacteriovorax stolpii]AUN99549.1 hypothetical protein C0V70_15840 [Bacteriovorax stolpii]TDP51178.1 PAS domain S-box-containing protein [Bacteriovorax stolpii]
MKKLLTNKVFKDALLAITLPLIALFLQYSLESINNSREWLFFYPAIFITAWRRGSRPGYIATIFCGLLAVYFLIPPAFSFKLVSYASTLEILIFSFMGISTSFLMGKIHARYSSMSAHSEELERSTEYLSSLLENIPLMVFVKDAKDLRFIRFNKAGEELLGFSRSELIGKSDFDFFPKEQAEFFISKDRDVLAAKRVVDIKEEMIQTRNQGTRILHTKKIPLYGPNGEAQYLLGVSEDITEKKKQEEEILRMIKEEAVLKERELSTAREIFLAKVSTLLSASLDYHETLKLLADLSVTALGDWCTISIINEKGEFERATGAHVDKNKQVLLEEYLEKYPPDKRVVSVTTETSYYNPQILDSQLKSMIKDQRQYELLMELGSNSSMIVPIKARGKVRGSLAFIAGKNKPNFSAQDLALAEDLGRRAGIAIENALLYSSSQDAIRARDEFVSIASHELKTPITSLKMQLQMMLRGVNPERGLTPPPEKLMKALVNSSNQVDRLTLLIEDLLDVTRIARGKLTYHFEEVNLSKLVREVLERFSEEIQFSKCELTFDLEDSVMVYCDRYRIEQVTVNLLSNAIKYGANQPIHAIVKHEAGKAILMIQDKGMGIPKDMQTKIFERFERAISSTNISGLGLGLYISKQIIDAHQGTIEVESELGKGSTFKVSLPTGL